jgi:hypothetical protein
MTFFKWLGVVGLLFFGLFCLFLSGMYIYMTVIHYSGESFILPAFQTAVIGVMSIFGMIVSSLNI